MSSTRSSVRWAAATLAVGLVVLGAGPFGAAARAASASPRGADFNGDGYADLVVGAPAGTVGGRSQAGYVVVMYGGPHGLSTTRETALSRATTGIPGDPAKGERFGNQVSEGDLNGDGYADLVVSGTGSGSVIVWGGAKGLSGGTAVPGYGSASETGDFNGDGRLDLALFQTSFTDGDDPTGTRAVVWYGPVTRTGTPAGTAVLDPGPLSYVDVEDGATGDVNHDGRTDLVLSDYCGDGSFCNRLYYGSSTGLVPAPELSVPQGFRAVALGDVNGDGYSDIVTGDSYDNVITVADGSASGVAPRDTWRTFSQDTPGVPGVDEPEDAFGASVAVGDVTGDGFADVAVGSPNETLGTVQGAGDVTLLHGSRSGLTGTGAQVVTQNTAGIPGVSEVNDFFGAKVQLLDINGNGYADLAASATGENDSTGAVWDVRGRPTGLVSDAALSFGPVGLRTPSAKAAFGSVLR